MKNTLAFRCFLLPLLLAAVTFAGAAPPPKTPASAKPVPAKPAPAPTAKDAETVQVTFPLGHTRDVQSTALSSDGRLVATASHLETILWERATGGEIRRLLGADMAAFSPDGRQIVLAGGSSFIACDVATGEQVWGGRTGRGGDIQDIAFSPDGKHFAIGTALSSTMEGGLYTWNAQTGAREATEINLNGKTVAAVAWMPDSRQVVAGCQGGDVFLCDGATGAVVRKLFNTGASVKDLDVPPDGKRLLVGTAFRNDANEKVSSPVRIWDIATGAPLQDLPVRWPADFTYEQAQSVRWAENGKAIIATFHSKTPVHVWDADGTLRRTFPYPQFFVSSFGLSRDGTSAVLPVGNAAALVSLADGSEQRFAGRKLPVNSVAYSENGKWGIIGAENGEARLLEAGTGRNVRRYTDLVGGQPIYTVSLSADGARACAATYDGKAPQVVAWETATGKMLLRQTLTDGWPCSNAVISADGKTVMGGNLRGQVRGWSVETGQELWAPVRPGDWDSIEAVGFRPDSGLFAAAGGGKLFLLDPQTGQTRKALTLPKEVNVYGGFVDWSTDGKYVAYVTKSGGSYVFVAETGTLTGGHDGGAGPAGVQGFGPGATAANYFVVAKTRDKDFTHNVWFPRSSFVGRGFLREFRRDSGGIDFYDIARSKTVLTLLPIAGADTNAGGEWLAYDDKGRFTGSEAAMQTVSVVTGPAGGETSLPIARFFERYFTPNLVTMTLGGRAGTETTPLPVAPLPSPTEALRTGAPPLVRLTMASSATTPTIEVTVEATAQAGGGVKAIRLYQNGRLVGGPSVLRGIAVEAVSGATTTKKFVIPLASGTNQLRAVAYSNTDLESKSADATITFNPAAIPKPALYVLAVGINTYKDATMNLTYARPDAESLADLFDSAKGGKAGGGLFAQAHVVRLLDGDATGAAILAGIGTLAQTAQPEDVVLVYLAGHGEMADDVWNFLPTEMRQMALPERVKEFGIAWPRIEAAVGKIRARKVILVLDACKSGGALTGGVRGVAEEQQALAIMARAQGIHILTASTSQQYAGEVKALGHGILTYALLEGLGGKGLAGGGSASVMVRELMAYVENRVPELSLQYRGEAQYPVPFDRGQNFPVAEKP